jgi:hypothetical protein
MRVHTLWKVIGAVMAALLLVGGTYQAVGALAHARSRTSRSLDAGGVHLLDVRNPAGPVRVVASDGDRIVVRARVSDGLRATGHSIARVDDRLVVRGSCPVFGGTWCSVSYDIEVPAGLDVAVRAGGHIEVFGIDGDVRAATDQGRITLDRVGGDVRATTDQGGVEGTRLSGASVEAHSDQGRIELAFADSPRRVVARTDQGRIVITLPDEEGVAYRTDTRTDQGRVSDPIRQDPGSDRTITAHSDQGDVTVRYAG